MKHNEWEQFSLGELFEIKKGTRLTNANKTEGSIRYIGAANSNNGVVSMIGNDTAIHPANVMTVCYNGNGGTGKTFYQDEPFWATDDVNVLYPKFSLTPEIALFIAPLIEKAGERFGFANKWKLEDMLSSKIPLPVDRSGQPDWQYMSLRMKAINRKVESYVQTLQAHIEARSPLDLVDWKEYPLTELFHIHGSKTTPKNSIEFSDSGTCSYVTTAATNNGVYGRCDTCTERGNVITVDSAVLGTAFYQKADFCASDHVEILEPKFRMSEPTALFLVAILNATARHYGYSYSEKRSQKALKMEALPLPASRNGEPDWDFIESYMESISSHVEKSMQAYAC